MFHSCYQHFDNATLHQNSHHQPVTFRSQNNALCDTIVFKLLKVVFWFWPPAFQQWYLEASANRSHESPVWNPRGHKPLRTIFCICLCFWLVGTKNSKINKQWSLYYSATVTSTLYLCPPLSHQFSGPTTSSMKSGHRSKLTVVLAFANNVKCGRLISSPSQRLCWYTLGRCIIHAGCSTAYCSQPLY